MENIYHIVSAADWAQFEGKTVYFADSLATEGFVHCCTQSQVAGVLERFYAGQSNFLLLQINPTKLTSELRYEAVSDSPEAFPHIYGVINMEAIEIVESF
jgi:uncharacterized protein (DUF952 family)